MDQRGQFTFYRSFWDAVKGLPKKDRLPILESIISYALDGNAPSGLTYSQTSFFLLCKPTLDSSRKKAANGRKGGSMRKQNGSKTEANVKQTESEIEKELEIEIEKEKEIELEIENECLLYKNDDVDVSHTRDFEQEASVDDLAEIGISPGDYLFLIPVRVVKQVLAITGGFFAEYCKCKYTPMDCKKVFQYITRWYPEGIRVLRDPVDLLRYAFEQSVMSRCPGNWRYIDAVMATMQERGITTAAEAQAYDDARNCGEV